MQGARLQALRPLRPEFRQLDTIQLAAPEFTVGRSLDNSAVVEFLAISRKHCTFRRTDENGWTIQDLSAFGVHLNDKKLNKGIKHKLTHNDVLRLDPNGEFVYKFVLEDTDFEPPNKRIKLEPEDESSDVIQNVKQKFEASQNFEVDNLEKKIKNIQHLQNTSIILKQQLELDMERKIQQLEAGIGAQIESLRGEKDEVERQKAELVKERDTKLADMKIEMDEKINVLLDQIAKHNETESELLKENSQLKERLVKEREVFLEELSRENASKQGLLQHLEDKLRLQEEIRLREKQLLEESLKKEIEQLNIAREQALKELEEQMRQEKALKEAELHSLKRSLEERVNETAAAKARAEQEYQERLEELQRAARDDKTRIEEMCQAREEAERKLKEAQENTVASRETLERLMLDKELEHTILAEKRLQEATLKSNQLVSSLQEQLDKVRSELEVVQIEKYLLHDHPAGEGVTQEAQRSVRSELGELMENELQCTICSDLLIQAVTLNCSHTFCKYCIARWKKKKKECPVCRTPVTTECRSLVLDSFIEKMVANLTDEMKQKRIQVLKDREELEAQSSAGHADRRRANGADTASEYSTEGDSFSEGEGEGGEEDDEDSERYHNRYRRHRYYDDSGSDDRDDFFWPEHAEPGSSTGVPDGTGTTGGDHNTGSRTRPIVAGLPNAYYGGYGRCFACGARGHWAPGCPFN